MLFYNNEKDESIQDSKWFRSNSNLAFHNDLDKDHSSKKPQIHPPTSFEFHCMKTFDLECTNKQSCKKVCNDK
ncbi:hypothetical protein TSUD_11440 [Trifolium subterraneum]|nr:hypothetical protein TSUD_11440 [Trifolium subterraneum]